MGVVFHGDASSSTTRPEESISPIPGVLLGSQIPLSDSRHTSRQFCDKNPINRGVPCTPMVSVVLLVIMKLHCFSPPLPSGIYYKLASAAGIAAVKYYMYKSFMFSNKSRIY